MEKKAELFWLAYVRMHHSGQKRPVCQDAYYSLIYVKKGPVLLEMDGERIAVAEGEYTCIPRGTTYGVHHTQNRDMEYYFLRFTLNDPFLADNLRSVPLPLTVDRSTETEFSYLAKNWNNKDVQSQTVCENFLISLLLLLFVGKISHEEEDSKFVLTQGCGQTTRKIFYYLENNFLSRFTLEEMGRMLGYNQSYLSAVFSRETGVSITGYTNFLRVRTAIVGFLHFSYSVSVAAERMGFNSLSYFNRTFKGLTGISPGMFLKGMSRLTMAERSALADGEPILSGHACTMEEAFASMRRLGEIAGNAKKE